LGTSLVQWTLIFQLNYADVAVLQKHADDGAATVAGVVHYGFTALLACF
jgi:hypothetical protein